MQPAGVNTVNRQQPLAVSSKVCSWKTDFPADLAAMFNHALGLMISSKHGVCSLDVSSSNRFSYLGARNRKVAKDNRGNLFGLEAKTFAKLPKLNNASGSLVSKTKPLPNEYQFSSEGHQVIYGKLLWRKVRELLIKAQSY